MNLEKKINSLVKLGNFLSYFVENKTVSKDEKLIDFYEPFEKLIQNYHVENGWFTEQNIKIAISGIAQYLNEIDLKKWLNNYPELNLNKNHNQRILVVMAGNIPMVGFHDLICVLVTNNIFIGKLSSQDNKLLPFIGDVLKAIEPEFNDKIYFTENKISDYDKVIATGSNNTSRYFKTYFGKYPNIIRRHRNSIAVINGSETPEELEKLTDDIFMYFGLGCRNVSKLFIPEDFDLKYIFEPAEKYKDVANHNKYRNNYDYYKAIYLMNGIKFFDNNFLILAENESYASPISIVYFERYNNINSVIEKIEIDKDFIQCIISKDDNIKNKIPFGATQFPSFSEYADNIDTIEFLLNN